MTVFTIGVSAEGSSARLFRQEKPYWASVDAGTVFLKRVRPRHVFIFGLVGGLLIATLQYTEYS